MLLFKYTKPIDYYKVESRYSKPEIKPVDAPVLLYSSDPNNEWNTLFTDVWMMKAIVEQYKDKYLRDWTTPKDLQPTSLESYPGSYNECCAFVDMLDMYYHYLVDNKERLVRSSDRMTELIQTMIIVEDKEVKIITQNKDLKQLIRQKIKEYVKYGFSI